MDLVPKRLVIAVNEAIPKIFDGALRDIVEDTGGLGLCDCASREAATLMGKSAYLDTLWLDMVHLVVGTGQYAGQGIPCRYPVSPKMPDHCVLHLGEGWMVDLTARQYDESLPFPFYWRLTDAP